MSEMKVGLEKLQEMVTEARGPDRDLDADIARALEDVEIQWKQSPGTMESYPAQRYSSASNFAWLGIGPVPKYTASIDDVIALVERVLPGWGCQTLTSAIYNKSDRSFHARLFGAGDFSGSSGSSLPLAILAALLSKALQTQDQSDKGGMST